MDQLPQHIHGSSTDKSKFFKSNVLGTLAGFLIPVLLPFFHLGIISHLWDEFNYKVDRKGCSCSCWDTIFKGIYERGPSGYKHIYFNITSNTFKIWMVTVLSILLIYESVKRTLRLHFSGQLRKSMLVLLIASVYPHYYSWWSYFNYWNDDFYRQWNHQLFFSITELISTLAVVYLLDKNIPITARSTLIIIDIAILHIMSSSFDQFVTNVINGNGMLHQVLRDIFFMIPDILHVALPLLELKKLARSRNVPTAYVISNREFFCSVSLVIFGWFVCLIL
ncbi:uncharacterized protein LOC125038779 [Penaeus chinensis]|uniref:uncharacterized protein LOC125038779 n=1 Tax=Penaeus chinensis TaxID=139456 RepID=UPI001FB7B65D|nr:uncharacterized protein LOC125038779 [Penaeus chinensis]XP_047488333.1 uncharacterized protein LOC125038779 [Penaeus chinensis]